MRDKLNHVYDLRKQLNMLMDTRKAMYNTVHSTDLTKTIRSKAVNDPTAKAVNRIISLDEKIEEIGQQYTAAAVEVLEWLYSVDPDEMRDVSQFRTIVLCHYLKGLSWRDTARMVLNNHRTDTAKKIVRRYFMD